MADGLYVGMSAASARSQQLDSIADNLANAETPGFKAARAAFQSFLPTGVRATDKVFAGAVATGVDLSAGLTNVTDNPLDVTPEGQAFLGVALPNGQQAFTRNGSLGIDAQGVLSAQGLPVLGVDGNPIVLPPQTTPTIQADGTVLASGRAVGQLAMWNIAGPVAKLGASFLTAAPGGQATQVADGKLRVGELEMGNAPPLEAAVQMISAQRHFETAMQAISTYKRLDDRAMELGRVR